MIFYCDKLEQLYIGRFGEESLQDLTVNEVLSENHVAVSEAANLLLNSLLADEPITFAHDDGKLDTDEADVL